ncbi:MAG: N-acetylmuramoyl-L-alanine amidase [Clostridia bacterium]|nr:N-acetylmuramoyl-L-alanine amidase [Clostridia bacterium]
MDFTNSPLSTVTLLSPNHSGPRNHAIDTVTVHCTQGQCTARGIGEIFLPEERRASSNYGIGYDGEIGLYVEERNRSWCSSSAENDHRAITVEVSSDATAPYAVSDRAYEALIALLCDICVRNGIDALRWRGDPALIGQVEKQNMTVHCWFKKKDCPGQYLYERHADIAARVNARLAALHKNEREDGVCPIN